MNFAIYVSLGGEVLMKDHCGKCRIQQRSFKTKDISAAYGFLPFVKNILSLSSLTTS